LRSCVRSCFASLSRRGDWLVIDVEDTGIDHRAVEILERVWPQWRDCVSE